MGPLKGLRILEVGGIGPGPFCGMAFADMGADVILFEYPAEAGLRTPELQKTAFARRGKRSIQIDLKDPDALATALELVRIADVLIEGFRPGVMERLGLGPKVCLEKNPKLVYGRMTGWGQDGPLALAAGHDLNYLSLSGLLNYDGEPSQKPFPPPTVIGDVGGGALVLAMGILAAIYHVKNGGEGQVIDAAIVDGAAYLGTLLASITASGMAGAKGSTSLTTGGAPWANSYQCADSKYISVQSLEPKFYQLLLELCGLTDDPDFQNQFDQNCWQSARTKLERLFKTRTREEWCSLMEGTDACFAPVLSPAEAHVHPHGIARGLYVESDGHLQPAPAPRFEKTATHPGDIPRSGQHTDEILREAGLSQLQIDNLVNKGSVRR